jgi:Zn-dependent peptidase ImmA (M78 family)
MLEFDTCYSLSQIPYATNDALDDFAEKVIADFAPMLLKNPGVLDVDEFLEYYLGLTVDFRRISYDKMILGVTAFNDGTVDVINDEGQPYELEVKKGTVIIDSSLTNQKSEPRLRFTMMHEGGGHWLLHRKAFADDNPFGPAGIYANQYLAAKEGRGDSLRSQKERNDIERMERQADFISSALLMPRPSLREVYREFFRFYGEKPHRIVRGVNTMDDCFALQLPEYVAKIYHVSKKAATIRLEKLTAIVNRGWDRWH